MHPSGADDDVGGGLAPQVPSPSAELLNQALDANDRAVASEQSGQGEDETPVALAPSPLSGLRLLLIEDERHTREAVAIALEHHGATILAVSSAEEGRAALETFGPDVVLCDIAMPLEDDIPSFEG